MRKVLTIALSAVAAAALSGTPAHASSDSKVPLLYGPLVGCAAVADSMTGSAPKTESYVKLKHDDDGGVRVELGLRDAAPDTTFEVRVVQLVTDATTGIAAAASDDCNTVDGKVKTDDRGRAKIRITEDRVKDADSFQVFAYPMSAADSKEAPSGYHTEFIPLDGE